MHNLLSIGEVSRLKCVSVKSLRYYGDIGILPPAYINPQTGYRYYSTEQLIAVDIISVCIDLEIPLKNFNRYQMDNGRINASLLLDDGKRIAAEKQRRLKNNILFLNKISEHIENTRRSKKKSGEFRLCFEKRYFLTTDWNGDYYNFKEFNSKFTALYKQCKELNIPDTFDQGVIFIFKDGQRFAKIFLGIPELISGVKNLIIIPDGEYLCKVIEDDQFETGVEKYIDNKSYSDGSILIVKELYDITIDPNPTPLQYELLIKNR